MNSLKPEEFENLLARLDPDASRAAQEYELLRRKLVKLFERKKCLSPDELADETIDRVARKLEKQEIHDIASFACGVAPIISIEFLRSQSKLFSILSPYQTEIS